MTDATWPDYTPQPITLTLIRALDKSAPPDKPREIRDKAAGLILRHQRSGYLGLYVSLGRGKRERLCDARRIIDPQSTWTLARARSDGRRINVEHENGRDFSAERKARAAVPTLEAFIDNTYKGWLLQNRRNGEASVQRIKTVYPDLLSVRLDVITPVGLEPWRLARKQKGVQPETINRDIADLRRALTRAVKLEIIKRNNLLGIEMERVDRNKQVVRALTSVEKSSLYTALEARDSKRRAQRTSANQWRTDRGYELKPAIGRFADVLTPAVITSLETGLRRNELFSLRWPSVDLDQREIHVEGPTAKSFQTRTIPLNQLAYRALRDWWLQNRQPKRGYVMTLDGQKMDHMKKSYHAALKVAGIERVNPRGLRVNWHSLRHTFGTLLGAALVDPTTLMRLMGHANLETTQRYLHTDENRKRAAVEMLSGERGLKSDASAA
jgi:integrase